MFLSSLKEGFDPFGEFRVVGVLLDDDLTEIAGARSGEGGIAANQIGFEVGTSDPVAIANLENDGLHQTRVLLHGLVTNCRVSRPRKRHRFKPDEGIGEEGFAATVEEEGVGAVSEGFSGVVMNGGIDRSEEE